MEKNIKEERCHGTKKGLPAIRLYDFENKINHYHDKMINSI